MPREKKDARPLNIKLEREIYEQLEQFCDESGMTKTIAVERILRSYLNDYFVKPKHERALFD